MQSTNQNHPRLWIQAALAVSVLALIAATPLSAYALMQLGPAGNPVAANVAAAAAPDLSVTKTCALNPAAPSVLCTVTIKNNGMVPSITPLLLSDVPTAPAGSTFTGAGGTLGVSCSPGAGPVLPISCNTGMSIPAGQTRNVLFSFSVPNGGPFKNCVTTTQSVARGGPRGESNSANNTNICTTLTPSVGLPHNVALKKGVMGSGPYNINSNVTFVLNPFNIGPGPVNAGSVTINDPVPTGFMFVSAVSTPASAWTCSSVVTCTFNGPPVLAGQPLPVITLILKATTAGNLQNCGSITYNQTPTTPGDTDMSNNKDCATVPVGGGGGMGKVTVKKVVVPATDPGKFTLQLTPVGGTLLANFLNGGNGAVMGPVTVPAGNYTVSEVAGTGSSMANYTSVISGTGCGSNGALTIAAGDNKTCTITNTRIMVGFPLKKAFLPGSTMTSGSYTFAITNCPGYTGPGTVTVVTPNPGMISLNIPSGATCTVTETQPAGNWNPPLFGGSSAPINPTPPWTAIVGPITSANSSNGMTVSNKRN